jgi:hypothetical protein
MLRIIHNMIQLILRNLTVLLDEHKPKRRASEHFEYSNNVHAQVCEGFKMHQTHNE